MCIRVDDIAKIIGTDVGVCVIFYLKNFCEVHCGDLLSRTTTFTLEFPLTNSCFESAGSTNTLTHLPFRCEFPWELDLFLTENPTTMFDFVHFLKVRNT